MGDRSIDDLIVPTRPAFAVPGRVVVEGDFIEDPGSPPGVYLEPARAFVGGATFSRLNEDGRLLFETVAEDHYRIRGGSLGGLYLKSARYDGRDAMTEAVHVTDGGGEFEVVLSANGARVDGQVARRSEGVAGARVVLMPDDREKTELIKSTTTDQYGVFGLEGIAPGRYKVFAWERLEHSAWLDPNVLADAEDQGVSVEVNEGDAKRVTLKLIEAND